MLHKFAWHSILWLTQTEWNFNSQFIELSVTRIDPRTGRDQRAGGADSQGPTGLKLPQPGKDKTMRAFMLTLAAAVSAASLSFVAAPAFAAGDAQTCSVAPVKLRTLAAGADAETARKAERNIALGEALCDARNRSEAAKKFNLAAKSLGTELATVMSTETSASVQ
jgi:hypothetical protein